MKTLKQSAVAALALLFAACGGGDNGMPTPTSLDAPQVSATTSGTQATVTWQAVANAANYEYEIYKSGTSTPSVAKTTATHVTFLMEADAYRVRVRALPASGADYTASAWSSDVTVSRQGGGSSTDVGLPLPNENDGIRRAFPGAEGGGMFVTGGRDGSVYHVTTLADSGSGSLRDAVSQPNRTIVFDVAGNIELLSDLRIKSSNLTLAGQTAPGDGICVSGGTVVVDADNIIIRYMRFRLGDLNKGGNLSDGSDTIWGRYHSNIILDHCSMSWAIDEVSSFYANCNFTMQWCLLGEALCNSVHGKGAHGYGGLWGGKNASFHHNMLTCNNSRNARIDHPGIYGTYLSTYRGNVDYRNNVIYNWGDNSTYGGEDGSYNIVNNYYKPGPASTQRKYFVDAYWYNSSSKVGLAYPRLYLNGNHHDGSYASALNADNWNGGIYFHDQSSYGTNPSQSDAHLTAPLAIRADGNNTCYTSTHTAAAAYTQVLAYVGASKVRDAVDTRLTGDARNGKATYTTGSNGSKNGLIDSQKDVGGWPNYAATSEEVARVKDTDGDGIPDYYEDVLGMDKKNAADGKACTLDPQGLYTNLEVYLHFLVKDITAAQNLGATYTALD